MSGVEPVPFIRYRGLTGLEMFLYHTDDLALVLDKHMTDIVYNTGTNTLHLGHPRDRNGLRDQVNAAAAGLQTLPPGNDYLVVLAERRHAGGSVGADVSSGMLANLGLDIVSASAADDPRRSLLVQIRGLGYANTVRLLTGDFKRSVEITVGSYLDGGTLTLPTQDQVCAQAAVVLRQFFRALADRLDWILAQAASAVLAHAHVYTKTVSAIVSADEASDFGGILSTGLFNAQNQIFGSYVELTKVAADTPLADLLRARYTPRSENVTGRPNLVELAVVFGPEPMPLPGMEHVTLGIDTIIERLNP